MRKSDREVRGHEATGDMIQFQSYPPTLLYSSVQKYLVKDKYALFNNMHMLCVMRI